MIGYLICLAAGFIVGLALAGDDKDKGDDGLTDYYDNRD